MSEDKVSAVVVLRPSPGAAGQVATVETVRGLLPPPASVELTRSYFESRGFEVSEAFGTSFSITGPVSVFERVFGQGLETEGDRVVARGADRGTELSLVQLPADVADVVQAVVFPPAPDFGPGAP